MVSRAEPPLAPPPTCLLFIATSDVEGGRRDLLNRMLESVVSSASTPQVRVLLLLQNCEEEAKQAAEVPSYVTTFHTPNRIPLSVARNRLLSFAVEQGWAHEQTIFLFPDDDCWYPEGALDNAVAVFARDNDMEFWFCRYGSTPTAPGREAGRRAKVREAIREACSITLAVRGSLLRRVGFFDEGLGLGTAIPGGEDTEFALALFRASKQTVFVDHACVGHRDKNTDLVARYYLPDLVVIARYTFLIKGVLREFARKTAIGIWLMAHKRMSPRDFIAAAKLALACLGKGRPLRMGHGP